MEPKAHFEKTFTKVKWSNQSVPDREFEACTFTQCDLSHSDFSRSKFAECTFIGCDLSMVKLAEVSLRDVAFKECKLLGVDFKLVQRDALQPFLRSVHDGPRGSPQAEDERHAVHPLHHEGRGLRECPLGERRLPALRP